MEFLYIFLIVDYLFLFLASSNIFPKHISTIDFYAQIVSRELIYQELEFNGLCDNKYKIQFIIMIVNIQAVSQNT